MIGRARVGWEVFPAAPRRASTWLRFFLGASLEAAELKLQYRYQTAAREFQVEHSLLQAVWTQQLV